STAGQSALEWSWEKQRYEDDAEWCGRSQTGVKPSLAHTRP
ncbi:hypothetical protein A2U01_0089524, partial [Trifolium medium]|nr:hypothetical protein [Trifolium medium]